ncbi:hypothetical protein [Thiorhodococcus fuscus]|uniref:RiboL-PSP-HEPN domain-containing protein n=1 Tax=Thiorhodococcus fuscus TaxID=527200 RepID=A0ABW4Y6S9_9GAMM
MTQIWKRREALERDAANLLGRMLFEFSRLDVNVGLCLVWVDGGANLEHLTKTVENQNIKTKLDALSKHVSAKLPIGSKRRSAYENWISRTHEIRRQRNNLVHGRWGIDPQKNKVVNVVGLPTSDAQQITEYSIEDLAAIIEELRYLQCELSRLREHWPL